jgi:UDP-glucuronate 4-epimerase
MTQTKKILVTGAAGFIGFHLSSRLLENPAFEVYGLDSINDYYDPALKYSRLKELGLSFEKIEYNKELKKDKFTFLRLNLEDRENLESFFKKYHFDYVVNLAAQAGVRYSIQNPYAYLDSNLTGFLNILENCRHFQVKHLIYASSSSVYGLNSSLPFSVGDNVDHPISLYAATKKANELMAHTYSYLYDIPTTGLRFFTVYGPWGRPDMALFIFTKNILEGKPIDVFNDGNMLRDFTYVDDIVEGIERLIPAVPIGDDNFDKKDPDPSRSVAPYRLHNIGNNSPVNLMDFVRAIEKATGKEATINYMPIQAGDVPATYANVDSLTEAVGFAPKTPVATGIKQFIEWYRDYFGV